jgi:hypothetical protein
LIQSVKKVLAVTAEVDAISAAHKMPRRMMNAVKLGMDIRGSSIERLLDTAAIAILITDTPC